MREKINYMKKGQSVYLCKCQFLIKYDDISRCKVYFNPSHSKDCGDKTDKVKVQKMNS